MPSRRRAELTSARVPEPGDRDHARGSGAEVLLYLDLACPHCSASWARIRELPLRTVFRHFPVASKHPRSPALHAAAEAAGAQRDDAFWALVDSIYDDQGHVDDPHLWARVRELGLDLERFEADRRSEAIADVVRQDFEGGIRAGVVGTPAGFVRGRPITGDLVLELAALSDL